MAESGAAREGGGGEGEGWGGVSEGVGVVEREGWPVCGELTKLCARLHLVQVSEGSVRETIL